MDHIRRIVIGLGSNLGDRVANIVAAVDQLRTDRDVHVLRRSPLYETPPAGGPPQFATLTRFTTASWADGKKFYVLAGMGNEAFLRSYF